MPPKQAPKPKSRVTTRLKEGVGLAKVRNRSADLVKLETQFQAFVKTLKGLLVTLRNHHGCMMNLQKSRLAVAQAVAKLAERTPLADAVSQLPSPERPPEQVCSYVSTHAKVADKSKSYISKYAQFVIEYVVEWEKVITGRISVGLKKAEQLRVDLDHYQQKVESLRQSANVSMAKGKQVDGKSADRLSRNEDKFIKAKQEYDLFATDLCILIEEVTDRSWRDLHPLLIKLAQFDMTMSDDESKMMRDLNRVVKELKDVAARNNLAPQPRLKDIEHQKAELLNTRQGGGLTIEADDGSVFGGSTKSAPTTPVALPPGSVAPQGLGGFPVQVDDFDNRARSASYASFDSGADFSSGPVPTSFGVGSTQRSMRSAPTSMNGPTTSDLVAFQTSAAPPPTMDQLNDAYSYGGGRAASTGGLPPLGPSSGGDSGSAYGGSQYGSQYGGGSNYGNSPYGSHQDLTVYSGANAPAPAAPPPPPPMGAPPPPPMPPTQQFGSMTMYGSPAPPPQNPAWNSGYPQQQHGGYPPQQQQYGMQPQYGAPPPPNPYGMPPQQPPNSWGSPQGGPPQQGRPLNSTNPFNN